MTQIPTPTWTVNAIDAERIRREGPRRYFETAGTDDLVVVWKMGSDPSRCCSLQVEGGEAVMVDHWGQTERHSTSSPEDCFEAWWEVTRCLLEDW